VSKPFESDEMRAAIATMLRGGLGGPLLRAASSAGKTRTAAS